ncbi:MAG: hypothetical protein ABI333_18075 [bacterium]
MGCGDDPSGSLNVEHCDNGIDDNGDDLVDCADPQCDGHASCNPFTEYACDNGVDDDGDGTIDCDDPDCAMNQVCNPNTELACSNGVDDDEDGAMDCMDSDCWETAACQEVCDDGVDNDLDGLKDCDDVDCRTDEACGSVTYPEICDNQLDDDGDGFVDCEDDDCASASWCRSAELCNNGVDDDEDGLVDCEDDDCATNPWCFEYQCNNGLDEDGDGLVDCQDPDCGGAPGCVTNTTCAPATPIGCDAAITGSTVGRLNNFSSYSPPCPADSFPGGERYYSYAASESLIVTVSLVDPNNAGLKVFALGAGLGGCAQSDCLTATSSSAGSYELTVAVSAGDTLYFVVDGTNSQGGSYSLSMECGIDCGSLTNCDDQCLDTQNDPENCGGCGNACAETVQCQAGQCGLIGVDCGGIICPNQQQCCLYNGTEYCFDPSTQTCTGLSGVCDGPEDCAPGEVCCHDPGGGSFAACTPSNGCASDQFFCSQDTDCSTWYPYCCPAMGVFAVCSANPCPNP